MIFSTFLVIFDFINPGFFISEESDRYVAGRAAAMFLNPNIAGTALIISLILSIDIVHKKWRSLIIFFVFIGVALTFSRASILAYVVITFILMLQRKIEAKKILFVVLILMISFSVFLTAGISFLEKKGINTDNILGRITFFKQQDKKLEIIVIMKER